MGYAELLKSDVEQAERKLIAFKAERDMIANTVKELAEQLLSMTSQKTFHMKEKDLLQLTSRKVREQVYAEIGKTVTGYLQFIFQQPDMEFIIEPVYHERRTDLRFWTTKDITDEKGNTTRHKIDPLNGRGGGIVNVLTFALHLAMDLWLEPPCEAPWLLDEIFKNVSSEYIPRCIELLKIIQEKYGRQSIIVTHNTQLTKWGDNVYTTVLKPDGLTEIRKFQ